MTLDDLNQTWSEKYNDWLKFEVELQEVLKDLLESIK
jgi:hypothetical protein